MDCENRVLVAMSGGVDSTVAAKLLQDQGLVCAGGTMLLHSREPSSARDAATVCRQLAMEFHLLDAHDEFRQAVMEPFAQCYEQGLTPNPCIVCNKHLKFGYFLEKAEQLGFDFIATGHYAQIEKKQDGRYLLKKAANQAKDQTYFLYTLTQHQLAHTLFPLGGLSKEEVRQIAQAQGLVNASKRDSQDICFVPDGDYLRFLEEYRNKAYIPGNFLDLDGNIVGKHKGAVAYTLGQRKGLGVAMGQPVYVCGKDMERNTVTLGPNEALMRRCLQAVDWNWISIDSPTAAIRVLAKTRSRMVEQPATVCPEGNGYRVEFDEPQRAMTPGQAVVLYDGDIVVGGGTITEIL